MDEPLDVTARVAEIRRRFEEYFSAVAHEFPRDQTADELKLRSQIADLAVIDSCEKAGRVSRERADKARAQVLGGVSLSEQPLELRASRREVELAIIGAARFRAAAERASSAAGARAKRSASSARAAYAALAVELSLGARAVLCRR